MNRNALQRSLLVAATALTVTGGIALGATRVGTDGAETLTGTNGNDSLTGKGGNDTLHGLAGNDVYYFADGWGNDAIGEKAGYKVDGRKLPGGSDTLSFAKVTDPVHAFLIRQWNQNVAYQYAAEGRVELGRSVVENFVGGRGNDEVYGGGETNTLQPGGGTDDRLNDYGGAVQQGSVPALPASADVYKGFAGHGGSVTILDWQGGADVLDLRPFAVGDVYVDAVNLDPSYSPPGSTGGNTTAESLQVVTGGSTAVYVIGHLGEFKDFTSNGGHQGRIEKLIFADGTISGQDAIASQAAARASGKGARLAEVAERLADRAQVAARQHPPAHPNRDGADVSPAANSAQTTERSARSVRSAPDGRIGGDDRPRPGSGEGRHGDD